MIRWLWKSGKVWENEGEFRRRLDALEERQKRLEEGEAARELTVAHTLGQLQRLAGRVTKTLAIDEHAAERANNQNPTTAEGVISLARQRGLTR